MRPFDIVNFLVTKAPTSPRVNYGTSPGAPRGSNYFGMTDDSRIQDLFQVRWVEVHQRPCPATAAPFLKISARPSTAFSLILHTRAHTGRQHTAFITVMNRPAWGSNKNKPSARTPQTAGGGGGVRCPTAPAPTSVAGTVRPTGT